MFSRSTAFTRTFIIPYDVVERHQCIVGEPGKGALPSETRFHLAASRILPVATLPSPEVGLADSPGRPDGPGHEHLHRVGDPVCVGGSTPAGHPVPWLIGSPITLVFKDPLDLFAIAGTAFIVNAITGDVRRPGSRGTADRRLRLSWASRFLRLMAACSRAGRNPPAILEFNAIMARSNSRLTHQAKRDLAKTAEPSGKSAAKPLHDANFPLPLDTAPMEAKSAERLPEAPGPGSTNPNGMAFGVWPSRQERPSICAPSRASRSGDISPR